MHSPILRHLVLSHHHHHPWPCILDWGSECGTSLSLQVLRLSNMVNSLRNSLSFTITKNISSLQEIMKAPCSTSTPGPTRLLCERHPSESSKWHWDKLRAKLWNLWEALSGVNRKQPNGLVKFTFPTHKNNWLWHVRQLWSISELKRNRFLRVPKWTTQGDSYGNGIFADGFSNSITFFYMLG